MITALWANSNFDDDKGTRKQAVKDLEDSYAEVIRIIKSGKSEQDEHIDPDNPFFRPILKQQLEQPPLTHRDGTVREALDYTRDIDQN